MTRQRLQATAAVLIGAALLLAGCANPGGIRPTHTLSEATAYGATPTQTPWPTARWWSEYGDADLDRLVDQGLPGQPSLKKGQARRQLAQAAAAAAGAGALPRAEGSGAPANRSLRGERILPTR